MVLIIDMLVNVSDVTCLFLKTKMFIEIMWENVNRIINWNFVLNVGKPFTCFYVIKYKTGCRTGYRAKSECKDCGRLSRVAASIKIHKNN